MEDISASDAQVTAHLRELEQITEEDTLSLAVVNMALRFDFLEHAASRLKHVSHSRRAEILHRALHTQAVQGAANTTPRTFNELLEALAK